MSPLKAPISLKRLAIVLKWVKKCKSFLGLLFTDGLPPYFTRFAINSVSVRFVEKEWYQDPNIERNIKKKEAELAAVAAKKTLKNKMEFDPEEYIDVIQYKPKQNLE